MGHYLFYEWVLLTIIFFQLVIASYVTWVSVNMGSCAIYCGLVAAAMLSWVLVKTLYHDYDLTVLTIQIGGGITPPFMP